MVPKDTRPPDNGAYPQAAGGRPIGVGPIYSKAASQLLANGYEPVPIRPGSKVPGVSRWSAVTIDETRVEEWSGRFQDHAVGLRTGSLVGLDIDLLDADLAHRIHGLASRRLGETLVRVGLWPKRLLLYRTAEPGAKLAAPGVEVLGTGQQFVAFGIHPGTGQPYYWPDGETPLEVPLDDLPLVDMEAIGAFLAEASALLPGRQGRRTRRTSGPTRAPAATAGTISRDAQGIVIDGRDGWLSSIAYHMVWDARDAGEALDADVLAARVWDRFQSTADISRPRQDGHRSYGLADASAKVRDKLRLLGDGRLPGREAVPDEPAPQPANSPVDHARADLDQTIADACDTMMDWHDSEDGLPPPQIGIRATVGLGKSTIARQHLLELRTRLPEAGHPHRIAVFTPSHALAEEAAGQWREAGVSTAVLHGYEAKLLGTPACRDIAAVRLAVEAGAPVHRTVCDDGDRQCRFHARCLKQVNRREIAAADVVFAAYDALWSGFAVETSSLGVVVIDEACWPRAATETRVLAVETFRATGLAMARRGRHAEAAMADLDDLRGRAVAAFTANGPGPLTRPVLLTEGLTAHDCREAVKFERGRIQALPLEPGASPSQRSAAAGVARHNATARACVELWRALEAFLGGGEDTCGRVVIDNPDPESGQHRIVVRGVRSVHPTLHDIPVLHLDATLRPELARSVLPRLQVTEIDAEAPHMTLRLITGGFGKTAIIGDSHASPEENARRAHKLSDVVAHVAWEARRVRPGRTLVITYKDCEAEFEGIPGVVTAHFNAIAGLDAWKDVGLLIVVGRPLPSDMALEPLVGTFFGQVPAGGYVSSLRGIRMRDGSERTVRTIAHADTRAEILRAAISDDELIQAIGRGRAVNRTAADPLEVQVLSDVALPLVHDSLAPWDMVVPDIVQRMLLAGVAVDSPADACRLHSDLFTSTEQAKKAFQRAVFKGQTPIKNTYRGMSLKSAAYRRPGRGAGWQRAYWVDGDANDVRQTLSQRLGAIAEWKPAPA